MKKVFILTTLCLSYIANVEAQVDPYDINDGDNVVKISNSDVKGTFIPSEGALELTFKKDTDNMNIIMAINMGGDDFIAKPFDLNVLTAKIQAMLRRSYDFSTNQSILEAHGVTLNLNDTSLIYGNQKIDLTKNEFRIMSTLMENKDKYVSRD